MKMPEEITLRYQQIGDAKRFMEILNNPNFHYFPARPASIEAERKVTARKRARGS